MEKLHWQSRWTFILAAIGSAAGLGNLWRFPYQVYDHGGWAFIIAYLVLLFLVGLGLLVGEIAIGQRAQRGAPGSYAQLSKYMSWIGWFASIGALAILSYYLVVVAWGMDYLWYSATHLFSGGLPWSGDASGFFYGSTLGLTDGISDRGVVSRPVLYGLIASLVLLYAFTYKSVKSVGKVIWVTATLPFVTLILLAIYASTLDGSIEGLKFLMTLDTGKLMSSDTWVAAAGQIFFTLSLAMGVMVVYGACKNDSSEIVKSTIIVALGNTTISFLSAITVFAGLGHLARNQGVGVEEVVSGGPGLVFVVFPELLATLGSIGPFIGVLFFSTVFLLAIDSAMSLFEGFARMIHDIGIKLRTEYLTLILIVITGGASVLFTFGNGLYFLDIIDHYITSYLMLGVGLVTAVLLTYIGKQMSTYLTKRSDWKWLPRSFWQISWAISIVVLGYLLYTNVADGILVYDSYEAEDLKKYGLFPILGMLIVAIVLSGVFRNSSKPITK